MTLRRLRFAFVVISFGLLPISRGAADPIYLGPEISLPGTPDALAFDGANFLAVWPCDTAICGARITPAGTFAGSPSQVLVTTVAPPSHLQLACDGANCLVAWREQRGAGEPDAFVSRVSPSGTSLDGTGINVTNQIWLSSNDACMGATPAGLVFDGVDYTAAMYCYGPTFTRHFHATISTDAAIDLAFATGPFGRHGLPMVKMIWTGQETFTVIASSNYLYEGISYIAWLPEPWVNPAEREPLYGPFDMDVEMVLLRDFALSADQSRTLLTFERTPGGVYACFGFECVPPEQLYVVGIHLSGTGADPVATFDGSNHVIVWTEASSSVVVRVTAAGAVLDAQPIPVAEAGATQLVSNGRGSSLVTSHAKARLLVTDIQAEVADVLAAAGDVVAGLDAASFRNANQQRALANKLSLTRQLVDAHSCADALVELAGAINKTDGCAAGSAPDANDWITTCSAQRDLHAALAWAAELIEVSVQ